MRVGFTGSQGTGKSTTARRLSELTDWPVLPSTARLSKAAGYKINREATPDSQLFTMLARTSLEDKVMREHGSVVSDRTPLDSLAYTWFQFKNVWQGDNQFYWDVSREHVLSHMQKYDLVVYFPVLWAPRPDGVRDLDIQYQQAIDRAIVSLASQLQIHYVELPDASVDKRAEWVRGLLTSVS